MAAGVPSSGPRVGLAVSRFPRMNCRSKQGRIVAWDANPPERNRRTAGNASLIYRGQHGKVWRTWRQTAVLGPETGLAHRSIVRVGTLASRGRAGLDGLFEADELSGCPGCTRRLDMDDDGG